MSVQSIPPKDLSNCIGIICNGELEIIPGLSQRVHNCRTLIGADGGLNHCEKISICPEWIVGDFDSVNRGVLEKYKNRTDVVVLPRAKDCTDLEAAIEKAKAISIYAQIIIWGGLGGRIDHTLANLFLLFRHPARLFLESAQQTLFAVSDKNATVQISHQTSKTVALFPLNGAATNVRLHDGEKCTTLPIVDKYHPHLYPFHEVCTLTIESGELLVILEERELSPLEELPQTDISVKFSLDQPLIHTLSYLMHQSLHFKAVQLFSDKERIFNLQIDSNQMCFKSQRGQTVSLIPFYGAAEGIETHGLKWELSQATLDRLDKDFVGVSNVSMGDTYSVKVSKGELLCIVNPHLIDVELADAKIN
jgi:thiamine pyrophosphokinase